MMGGSPVHTERPHVGALTTVSSKARHGGKGISRGFPPWPPAFAWRFFPEKIPSILAQRQTIPALLFANS